MSIKMTALAFDTHEAVKTLREAGAEKSLAEAVVATIGVAVGENMASKADIGNLRTELKADISGLEASINGLRIELKADINGLRTELKSDVSDLEASISGLGTELKADIKALQSGLEILRKDMTIRLGGMIAAGVTLIVAFDKLF